MVFTWVNVFYARCALRCHLSVTVVVPVEDDLRVQFAPLHPHKE